MAKRQSSTNPQSWSILGFLITLWGCMVESGPSMSLVHPPDGYPATRVLGLNQGIRPRGGANR